MSYFYIKTSLDLQILLQFHRIIQCTGTCNICAETLELHGATRLLQPGQNEIDYRYGQHCVKIQTNKSKNIIQTLSYLIHIKIYFFPVGNYTLIKKPIDKCLSNLTKGEDEKTKTCIALSNTYVVISEDVSNCKVISFMEIF